MDAVRTYQQVEQILLWYWEQGAQIQSIDNLLDQQDKLSILSFRLAEVCAESKLKYNSSSFMKTIAVERSVQNIMKQDVAYNKAKSESLLLNELKFEQELRDEAEAYRNDLLLKQVNRVLQAMQQRISYIKKDFNPHNNTAQKEKQDHE